MEKKKHIQFKYIFADDYNPVFVNGAHGGITPRGEIEVNFFLERHALPYSQTLELKEDGSIGGEIGREPKEDVPTMVRFITTGVIMNLSGAKIIHEWLGNHIETLEKAQAELKDKLSRNEGDDGK